MASEIRTPAFGQTSGEVRLVLWLVKEGDQFRKGAPLCKAGNGKAVMPLEVGGRAGGSAT